MKLSRPRAVAALLVVAAPVVVPAAARATRCPDLPGPQLVTFQAVDQEQSCVIPPGVGLVRVMAVGGTGASDASAPGGVGAVVSGSVPVSGGATLYVEVGGNGDVAAHGGSGGFNGGGVGGVGGGGGGGASDIRTVSRTDIGALASRVLVAAGGGGAGTGLSGGAGGAGGSADAPGGAGQSNQYQGGSGGGAGTASAGGTGGANGVSSNPAASGGAGTLGEGGAGGQFGNATLGAGGGGGLYGGGGGGAPGGIDQPSRSSPLAAEAEGEARSSPPVDPQPSTATDCRPKSYSLTPWRTRPRWRLPLRSTARSPPGPGREHELRLRRRRRSPRRRWLRGRLGAAIGRAS